MVRRSGHNPVRLMFTLDYLKLFTHAIYLVKYRASRYNVRSIPQYLMCKPWISTIVLHVYFAEFDMLCPRSVVSIDQRSKIVFPNSSAFVVWGYSVCNVFQ